MSRLAESCGEQHDEFFELVLIHPLRPIRTKEELSDAIEVIDRLLERCDLSADANDYLETLTGLIESYESMREEIGTASDADVLSHLLEAKKVKQVDVARATGIVEPTISDVMRGRRKFSREQIGKLAKYFHVSPTIFSFDSE